MATFYSNSDRGYSLVLEVTQVSQDKARNQSTIRSKLTLRNTNVTFAQYTITGSMVINGTAQNYSAQPSMLSYNSSIVLLDKTQTVSHNSNGTKTITVSASIKGSGGWSPGLLSIGNNSFKLSDIHRASKVSGSDGFVGDKISIIIQSHDSSFTHNLRYRFGSLSGYIVKGIKGTYNWQVPATFAEQLPNVTSGRGTLWCETYSGSSKIGESQFDFTLRVPDDYRPSLMRIDLSEIQPTVGKLALGPNTFVQILSDVQVTFGGASGVYGSTIVSYKSEIVGKNQSVTENQGRFGLMNFSGEALVRASVTDSRGRTSPVVEKTIMVTPYHAPMFSFSAVRSGAQNTSLTVTRNAQIAPLLVNGVQKNKMKLTFKTAPYGETNYTTNLSNASGTYSSLSSLVNSQANLSGTYDTTKSFEIIGILEDNFTNTEFKVVVGTEQYVYTYDQHGVGIMKAREHGALDVAGDIYADNKPIQHHQLTDNNGLVMSVFDANLVKSTGFYYMVGTRSNVPGNKNGYLTAWCHSDSFMYQMFVPYNTSDLYTRRKISGVWSDWTEYVTTDHRNLVNTGWISTGVTGVQYKRVGDIVSLRFDVQTRSGQAFALGSIPDYLVPNEMMFYVSGWTIDYNLGRNLQINATGSMALLTSNRGDRFKSQISWSL